VFVFTNLVELPFGRGKHFLGDASGALEHIVGGWQINTVTNWSGGLPFSPGISDCGFRDTGPCRPNIVGDVSTGDRNGWFTTTGGVPLTAAGQTAGPWQRPQAGVFGTAGRNSLRGPGYFNTDLSLFKSITVSERVRAQFRFEAFNVFNHVNLGTPGVFFSEFGFGGSNCVDCSDGGIIRATGGAMRQLQFGLHVKF
jgi:hypothetical protein